MVTTITVTCGGRVPLELNNVNKQRKQTHWRRAPGHVDGIFALTGWYHTYGLTWNWTSEFWCFFFCWKSPFSPWYRSTCHTCYHPWGFLCLRDLFIPAEELIGSLLHSAPVLEYGTRVGFCLPAASVQTVSYPSTRVQC